MSFGENVKHHRKKNKLTQTELANMINKTIRTVQKYESGEITPTVDIVELVAEALNVTASELLGTKDMITGIVKDILREHSYTEKDSKALLPIFTNLFPDIEIPKYLSANDALEYGIYEAIASFFKDSTRVLTSASVNDYFPAYWSGGIFDPSDIRIIRNQYFEEYTHDMDKARNTLDKLARFRFDVTLKTVQELERAKKKAK